MSRQLLKALLTNNTVEFDFYNRHRGILEGNTSYYATRPNSSWTSSIAINITVNSDTTCKVLWGDTANTETIHTLTVLGSSSQGYNIVSFNYTSIYDTEPENPTASISDRYAREKRVIVTFANNENVTELSFNKADITRFGELGVAQTSISYFGCAGQLLENIPPLPSTLQTLSCGLDMAKISNQQSGNKIPYQAITEATTLCRNSLKSLITGTGNSTAVSVVAQAVSPTQIYDVSIFPNLENLYFQSSGASKLIVSPINTGLRKIICQSPNVINRPILDISQLYIPSALQDLKFGASNSNRAESLITGIQLQTARDLTSLDLAFCFVGTRTGSSTILARKAFYDTVYNLWLNRVNHVVGIKTANFNGNGSVSVSTSDYPSGVTTYINDLMDLGWSITYTA